MLGIWKGDRRKSREFQLTLTVRQFASDLNLEIYAKPFGVLPRGCGTGHY